MRRLVLFIMFMLLGCQKSNAEKRNIYPEEEKKADSFVSPKGEHSYLPETSAIDLSECSKDKIDMNAMKDVHQCAAKYEIDMMEGRSMAAIFSMVKACRVNPRSIVDYLCYRRLL